MLYQILHTDLFCGTSREHELCLTFVLSFTEAARGETCLINLNFSHKSLSVPLKISKCVFESTAWFIATHGIFDSSDAASWDSVPDTDLRKFNSTSKSSTALTPGGVCQGDAGSASSNFILAPVPWFSLNIIKHNHIFIEK